MSNLQPTISPDLVKKIGVPGFSIAPHANSVDKNIIDELAKLPVAVVGDVLYRRGMMDGGIRPLTDNLRIAGRALTVETRPGDNLIIHAALKMARPGDVLVINGHGFAEAAVWGMLMTHMAISLQLAGLIIDGAIRDKEEIIESGFAAYARWTCPAGPHKDGPGVVNETISCGGVAVHSGDIVLGDADGILVISPEDAEFALEKGQAKVASENKRVAEIQQGDTFPSWLIPTVSEKGLFKNKGQ